MGLGCPPPIRDKGKATALNHKAHLWRSVPTTTQMGHQKRCSLHGLQQLWVMYTNTNNDLNRRARCANCDGIAVQERKP